ncbi:hypothetical protein [Halocatena marina]|uniref:Uncharacterized protein n=1 Tax=Halocatena marina TaxID=2934937 RepID=A0ABD5YSV7_9EURY|nr:hypothetical protein [Halocatena marina]
MANEAYETIDEAPTDGIIEGTPERLPTNNSLSIAVYNNLTRVFTGMIDSNEARDTVVVNRDVDVNRSISTETVKHSKRAINDSAKAPNPETAHEFEARRRWVQSASGERNALVDAFNESRSDLQ